MKWFEEAAIGGRVIVNVQARTIEAAQDASKLLGAAVMVGVMAKDFPQLEEGKRHIDALHRAGVRVSAGLGDGSADQWERALQLALETRPMHLNQIMPAAALSQYVLERIGAETIVNAMIAPTGQPGMVNIATGPESGRSGVASVPVDTAAAMIKEMGIRSIKFFPIEGTKRLDEVRAVSRASAQAGLMLEPTGGITPDNVAEIVQVCLQEGVRYVMPHLYGSLKSSETKDLDLFKLRTTYANIQMLLGKMG